MSSILARRGLPQMTVTINQVVAFSSYQLPSGARAPTISSTRRYNNINKLELFTIPEHVEWTQPLPGGESPLILTREESDARLAMGFEDARKRQKTA